MAKLPSLKDSEKETIIGSYQIALYSKKKLSMRSNYEKILFVFDVYMQKQ